MPKPTDKSYAETKKIVLCSLAGADTTATALRATILYIISKQQVLRRILAEFGEHGIENPGTPSDTEMEILSSEKLQHLSYLYACIREEVI